MLLRVLQFGGEIPVQGMRHLPDHFAVESVNTWLYSQELRALHPSVSLRSCLSTTRKVFRIPRGTVGGDPAHPGVKPPPSYLGDSTWLEFNDPDTDIVRGPLVNDSFKRWYFCSPTTGLQMNTYSRLVTGEAVYTVGVPNPIATLGISITGGVAPANVTRGYFYTFMNIYGEESGPCNPVTAAGKDDGTWAISGIVDPPPPDFTNYAAPQKKILYRSVTAASGTTTFFRVAEIPLGTTTYNDTVLDVNIASNLQFDNVNAQPPPAGLQGIISMPNGFLIGWKDSDLWFSEPYKPWSWPVEYVVATEYPIVGLGVFGQTCAVLTQGFPSTIQGIAPATTALAKSTVMEPCMSRGGIISTPEGVFYPSPNGLVSVSANGVQNITQALITKEEWVKFFEPAFLRGTRYQQGYLALRCVPEIGTRTAFYLDLSKLETAVTELSEFDNAQNVQGDVWSAEVFIIQNNTIQHHDPNPSSYFLPYRWRSKEFKYPYAQNLACYAIFWDQDRLDATSTDALDIVPAGIPAHLRVWADRRLIYDQNVPKNGEAARLPSGYKATIWQFEITGRAPVFELDVASTIKELRET